AYRAEKVPEKPARELGRIDHRHDLRLRLPRAEPSHGSLRALPAAVLRRIEIGERTRGRIPVIPLERFAALRDHAAADRMAARRIAADEAVAVRVDPNALARVHGRAFGILDARIELAGRGLGAQRELGRGGDGTPAVTAKVEVRYLAG